MGDWEIVQDDDEDDGWEVVGGEVPEGFELPPPGNQAPPPPLPTQPEPSRTESALSWLADKGRALHHGARGAVGLNALEERLGPDPVGSWLGEKFGASPEKIAQHQAGLQAGYDQDAAAAEANPWTSAAGGVGASLAAGGGITSGVGAALTIAPKLARMAAPLISGAADSAAVSAMEGGDVAQDAGVGALFGAGGKLAEKAIRPAANALREMGLLKRAASSGVYGGAMNRYAKNRGGREGLIELGQGMEELGLHNGRAMGGKLNPMNWLPQNVDTIADNADDALPAVQAARQQVIGAADAGGVQVPTDPTRQALLDLVARKASLPGRADQAVAGAGMDAARRLGNQPASFSRGVDVRQSFDADVDWARKGGALEDNAGEQVGRLAGHSMRGELVDSLKQQAPELAQPWQTAQRQYGAARQVSDWANERSNKELGNQLISLPVAAGGGLGMVGGGVLAGYDALSGEGDMGSAARKVAAGATLGAGMGLLKSRGKSAMAGMYGAAGRANKLAADNAVGAASALGTGPVGDAAADAIAPQFDRKAELSSILNETRGQHMPDVVQRALLTDPVSLGPYAKRFAGKTPAQITAELERLEPDREWSETYLPMLRQQTRPGGG